MSLHSTRIETPTMQNGEYIELPKDANGEYIHIGDVMENLREDLEPWVHHRFRVYSIQYRDFEQSATLTENGYPTILYRACECCHYHEPTTVEGVLREFAEGVEGQNKDFTEFVITEYAKKLREVVEHECN